MVCMAHTPFCRKVHMYFQNTPVKSEKQNGNGSKSPSSLTFDTAAGKPNEEPAEDDNKTLEESAAEYAAKQSLTELQEVETITGKNQTPAAICCTDHYS